MPFLGKWILPGGLFFQVESPADSPKQDSRNAKYHGDGGGLGHDVPPDPLWKRNHISNNPA
jgi:hypothetical protein